MSVREIRVTIPICIEPDEDGFHGYAPALRGCHVGGETLEETRRNLEDAVYLYLTSLIERNEPLPIGCLVEYKSSATEPKAPASNPLWPEIGSPIETSIYEQADLSIPVTT